MTVKELIEALVALGAVEDEIKSLKKAELEKMYGEALELEAAKEPQGEVKDGDKESDEKDKEKDEVVASKERVVRESSFQLGIYRDLIYKVIHRGAKVVIENLGYGDLYIDTVTRAQAGKSKRIIKGEVLEIMGADVIYFISPSQPTVQIIEVTEG